MYVFQFLVCSEQLFSKLTTKRFASCCQFVCSENVFELTNHQTTCQLLSVCDEKDVRFPNPCLLWEDLLNHPTTTVFVSVFQFLSVLFVAGRFNNKLSEQTWSGKRTIRFS